MVPIMCQTNTTGHQAAAAAAGLVKTSVVAQELQRPGMSIISTPGHPAAAAAAGSVKTSVVAQELYRPGVQAGLQTLGAQATAQLAPLREELVELRKRHDALLGSGPLSLSKLHDKARPAYSCMGWLSHLPGGLPAAAASASGRWLTSCVYHSVLRLSAMVHSVISLQS